MKKIKLILLTVFLLSVFFCGCSGKPETQTKDKISIVTTIFPEYDWVCNLLGDKADDAEVTLLLDSGVDLHSYQPTAEDMLKIAGCDIFIYVGGESDEWVEDALSEAVNKEMIVINLLDVLGDRVREEEIREGMEAEHEEDEHEHSLEEETEYDEHVWLSLRNAVIVCEEIADKLSQADPENVSVYQNNAEAYTKKLRELDAEYSADLGSASFRTLVFGDRFPFRYLTEDYGLDYYAAFAGCSAETEASFETIVFLATKTDELQVPAILTIDGSDRRIAETIRENTSGKDQKILQLDSMQSVTAEDVEAGASYYAIMKDNLTVLKEALQ